ncbi:hypothetical protein HIM_06291 [Hirsutella minnesotensis 3608]|uniref:Zn(2)-C6 fungal-type domain-containing protein n=1 Tax=Hirsutella minnesotensis 3608 TaxID=1043627 RepID=A0A0F7ZNT0_9HYPO|nr:hypothetical protein HIM_06291 [Hirsutella minnesotensis 3608]
MRHIKRHVKCDETRPSCHNCLKWRGYCNAYANQTESQPSTALSICHRKKSKPSNKPPSILNQPNVTAVRFANAEQQAYFYVWLGLSVSSLSGSLAKTRLWTTTMPQVSLEEPTLRYGAMAVGALRKAGKDRHPLAALDETNQHYLNALVYYCKALRLQAMAKPTRGGLRTALLSSLLFVCFEALRGMTPEALKHVNGGFRMLNELAACTDLAPDIVSIAPAPPAFVEEILECYRPLELQARSFMGSYRQFFFSPETSPTPADHVSPRRKSLHGHLREEAASRHFSQCATGGGADCLLPSSPLGLSQTGLPSPQSQGSPTTSESGQPSAKGPLKHPMLRILPFTKHTPYFRPKLSRITSLDDTPAVFTDLNEALGYWSLLQRSMVQHIPMLTRITSGLGLTRVQSERELETKLESVRQNPEVSQFVTGVRHLLQRWADAYEPLFLATRLDASKDSGTYLQAINLRIEYLILYIYTAIPRFSRIAVAKGLTPQYQEMTQLAGELLAARPGCGFSMDSGWTWPLFVAAFGCRGAPEAAVECAEGDEDAQWLLLRRREVVFEDFGASVIYRSAYKDPVTGRWGLVEEAASFAVRPDGRLDWRRVPVSDAASILSGVC